MRSLPTAEVSAALKVAFALSLALVAVAVAALVGAAVPFFVYLILFALPFAALIVIGLWLPRQALKGAPFWVQVVLFVVLGNFVLNFGFSNIAFGTSSVRATVSELLLAATLLTIGLRYLAVFLRWEVALLAGFSLLPIAIHLPMDFAAHGVVAARDALHAVDALFFLLGLAVVAAARARGVWLEWRMRFIGLLVALSGLYAVGLPFRDELFRNSPAFFGLQQYVPLLGSYQTGSVAPLTGLLALILLPEAFRFWGRASPSARQRWVLRALLALPLCMALLLSQSRAAYVAAAICMAIVAFAGHGKIVLRGFIGLLVVVAGLVFVDVAGIEVEGRIDKVGFSTVVAQIDSIDGKGGHETQVEGTELRLRWWGHSLGLWSESLDTVVLGIGYGLPLTDHVTGGTQGQTIVVREPHSSFVSTITRTGLVGFGCWMALITVTFTRLIWRVRSVDPDDPASPRVALWYLLFFTTTLLVAAVEPVLEFPYFAVPFYFLLGVACAEHRRAGDASWRTPVPVPLVGRFSPPATSEAARRAS